MAGLDLPEAPATLKSITTYLKVATTHDERDSIVSYWCRLYALQTGLKLSTKTSEETSFLYKLIDWLEKTKKQMASNEAITNDVVAQAHLENYALKLFLYADKSDRASNFGKGTIQSFYTAGLLYDVLTIFGELTDEASQNRKYAKWKAAYIHNCLKNGENPVPGPAGADNGDFDKEINTADSETPENENKTSDLPSVPSIPTMNITSQSDQDDNSGTNSNPYNPAPTPTGTEPSSSSLGSSDYSIIQGEGGVTLSIEQMGKAQKFIKWAGSALNYEDVPTAITNLRKALHLLTTGEEPA